MRDQNSNMLSRRQALAAISAAGMGLVVPPSLIQESNGTGYCIVASIDDLRNSIQSDACTLYFVTESGKEGFFYYDEADNSSADNTGTVVVSSSVGRFKRLLDDGSVNVRWFGAAGDMKTDDTKPIQNALDSGAMNIVVPTGDYIITSMLTLPRNVTLRGRGASSKLIKKMDGFIMTMSDQSQLCDMALIGNGSEYSGGGIRIHSGSSQKIQDCSVLDTAAHCVEYTDPKSGILSTIHNCLLHTLDKTKIPAVKYPDDETNGDRKLIAVDCNGGLLADFSGCSTVLVTHCNTVGVLFGKQSKKVSLIGNRIAGGTIGIHVEVFGKNHAIVGNMVATPIYIGKDTSNSVIMGNVAEVFDRSGTDTNTLSSNMNGAILSNDYGRTDRNSSYMALGAGGKSPNAASIAFGDGSGWKLNIGTQRNDTFVPLFSFYDTGCMSVVPSNSGLAAKNSLFVDKEDGKLKFKDGTGTIRNLY